MKWLALPLLALALAACSSAPSKSPAPAVLAGVPSGTQQAAACSKVYAPAQEDLGKRGDYTAGGLYAPHIPDTTPDYVPDMNCIPEPAVVHEPRSRVGNRSPYRVLDKHYVVMDRADGYVEQGLASYYGNKFHGRLTSNQEVYDMYAFTAAHKTLPLPSFVRVTNLDNGKSVVVRVNDRGPFHEGRVIDLSYAAAVKLDITQRGTGRVEVRVLKPGENLARVAAGAPASPQATGMDRLVGTLPPVQSAASAATPTLVDPRDPGRYRIVADTRKPPSADRFDAWLAERKLKVEGGAVVAADAPASTSAPPQTSGRTRGGQMAATSTAPTPPAIAAQTVPASTAALAAASASMDASELWLQVASYSSRDNAERALARLTAAGIEGTRLSDVQSNGRTFWRLRVGVPDLQTASELAGRIAGLGLGQPQVVRR
ncbi:MAG: septal ring lytic transglycosylase RlpA family protein [Pseudoxanthomonas sp.]|nr:septal ring lytic transglycosylase RlpA family protein [Pseudoxanthomonas sp.]